MILAALVLLLAVSAIAASAAAVKSARQLWLRRWVEQRLRGDAAADVPLERARRLLSGGAFANAVLVLTLGAVLGWASAHGAVVPVAALIAAPLLLGLLGRTLPRALGRIHPGTLIAVAARLLRGASVAAAPVRALSRRWSGPGRDTRGPAAPRRDPLVDALRAAELDYLATREERTIIAGVVGFGTRLTRDIMTPRADIFALDASLPWGEAARRVADSAFSRVPMYEGSPDRIVGMVHAFDILRAGTEAASIRRVLFVAPERPCSSLLFEMLRGSDHLAIVQDAPGRTIGLITIEDLLEELVGEIQDEHDEPLAERRRGRAFAEADSHALAGRGSA